MKARMLLAFSLSLVAAPAYADEQLVSLSTRPGVEQMFLLIESPDATASIILFAGGKGALNFSKSEFGVEFAWGKNNFLVRTRQAFADHGFTVAVVDAPSDHHGSRGMLDGFRTFAEHVADIDAVIAELRRRADVPVWLVGTSRGTESATHIAIQSTQKPYGLVLTSSMSEPNSTGTAVTEMDLTKITVPTLVVAHKQDACSVTPPEGAEQIKVGLVNSKKAEVVYFDGGRTKDNPCDARSYHGFLGIEGEVVRRIAEFIKNN